MLPSLTLYHSAPLAVCSSIFSSLSPVMALSLSDLVCLSACICQSSSVYLPLSLSVIFHPLESLLFSVTLYLYRSFPFSPAQYLTTITSLTRSLPPSFSLLFYFQRSTCCYFFYKISVSPNISLSLIVSIHMRLCLRRPLCHFPSPRPRRSPSVFLQICNALIANFPVTASSVAAAAR